MCLGKSRLTACRTNCTNCWDNYVFNTGTCTWENQDSQPVEPTATNCWDNYVFNTGTCTWENQGSQPVEPTATNCWG